MPPSSSDSLGEDSLRAEAADWFAKMRGPDAERHRTAFEQWLAEPGRGAVYERMSLRWDQSGLVGHTPPGQFRIGLPKAPQRQPARRPVYALAAGIAAVILISALYALNPFGTKAPPASAPALVARDLSTPVGAIRRLTLDDGSVVTLDTASRIAVAFTASERRVRLLTGRVRFEVAHDVARPFVVAAGQGEVVATGTMFDVSLIGARPQVRLIQGSVTVRVATGHGQVVVIAKLKPGQTVSLGDVYATPTALVAERWVTGVLNFDNVPLIDVLAEANRYAHRPIRLADPALGGLRVTGGFKANDQPAIAGALAAGLQLKVSRLTDGTLILER